MRRIAIIPARGGSKRLPDKNIRDFCGRPMISYSLEAALGTGLYDQIHVSTDSKKIKNVVNNLGHQIEFMRPDNLADDQTPILPVLKHVVETYAEQGETFDQVILIMACAPLIESSDLLAADKMYSQHKGKKAVMGVSPYPVPVEWAFDREENGQLKPAQPGMFAVRSQDLTTRYYDAGAFTLIPVSFITELSGAGDDSLNVGYILPKDKSVDIDSEEDWHFAETIYRGRLAN